jgi:hypothetical protein
VPKERSAEKGTQIEATWLDGDDLETRKGEPLACSVVGSSPSDGTSPMQITLFSDQLRPAPSADCPSVVIANRFLELGHDSSAGLHS